MAGADRPRQVPVVIVGAGPAGLVTAVTLARNGVGSLLVERNFAAQVAGQLRSWARTLAAWPSALTLRQARSTRPSSSRRKVERRTPTDVRP
jgi:2-polyprenyl-6-methoxyphenol hydroxylase-like FAD-dependent oxidoreductase